MEVFPLLSAAIVVAAVLSWTNRKFVRLPTTIGVMVISLAMSLALFALEGLGVDLRELAARHDVVGPVHGAGLFWGVELVLDHETNEPRSAHQARSLSSRLAAMGVLTGTVGRFGHALKIRPPLPFAPAHVERLVTTLDAALSETDWRADR